MGWSAFQGRIIHATPAQFFIKVQFIMPAFNEKKESDVQKHKSIWTAKQIWDTWQDVIYCNGSFWQWGGQVYKKIDDIDLTILTATRFPAFDESAPSRQKEILDVYKRFAKTDSDKFNAKDGLCFENMYLDLDDMKAKKHDKKRINTILIPYRYDDKAECSLFIKTINEIFINDINKIKCMQEFVGYCLTRSTKHKKALFMIGDGNTGKSTLLEVIEMLVGTENVSRLSPRLLKDSMHLSNIENKLLLVCHEIPKRLEDYESEFRQIVSGEKFNVHGKWIKPYDIKPFCKVIWAMNDLPRIDDHTSAFFNRILPLDFERIFTDEEQDKELLVKLKEELPGILNWALVGLRRLRERGSFYRNVYMQEYIIEMKEQNNPIAIWAKERIRIEEGKELTKQEAYKEYTVWCGLNGYKPLGHARFSLELYRIYSRVTKKSARSNDSARSSVWTNLTWATNTQSYKEQETWQE